MEIDAMLTRPTTGYYADTANLRDESLFTLAAQVALSRSIAHLTTLRSSSELLEEVVNAAIALGAQSAMLVLRQPSKDVDEANAVIIYRECGADSDDFRYLVGGHFRRMVGSDLDPDIYNQPPQFGWQRDRLEDGSTVYVAPIFLSDEPAGAFALMLRADEQLGSDDRESLAALATATGATLSTLWMMEATRHNAEELLVLYEVASYMAGATLDMKMLMRQIMVIASRVVRASAATLMLLSEKGDELIFEIPMGESGEALQEYRLPVGQGIGGTVVQEGRAIVVNNVAADPRWSAQADHFSGFKTRSVLCVPLQVHGRVIGALEVLNKEDVEGQPANFTPDDTALLSAIAAQAAAAIENAQLYQSLLQERDRIISTEEEVRRSFSRDLHDGPAQGLAAIIMRSDIVKRLLTDEAALRELNALQDLAKRTNKEVRTMLTQLRPIVLETRGLLAAMEEFVNNNQGDVGLRFSFTAQPGLDVSGFSESAAAAIYTIIQEAVNNIKKHAAAKNVWIEMSEQIVRYNITRSGKLKSTALLSHAPHRSLVVEIGDDGDGFNVDKVLAGYGERGSYGLLNMRERAELLGGDALIHSTPGEGTIITVRVPFPEPKS